MKANRRTTRAALTRLLMACWGTVAGRCVPLVAVQLFFALPDGDFAWPAAGRETADVLLAWTVVSFVGAALGVLVLRRRARASGLTLSADALGVRQTHLLRPMSLGVGWQERVRGELVGSRRAFLVAERGQEEIHFRWRPGRGDRSVWGSLAFDPAAGTVLLDVRDQEGLLGVAGLGKGSAFAAACQIARVTGLE
ncbi:hypothetical protein, partial [Streptomyces sp. NPDC002685]|uniref:hypothetical protein n=1 Tax=Streptomyces sp. NPDC002685 TaxID=3154540 RepID=UPI00331F1039